MQRGAFSWGTNKIDFRQGNRKDSKPGRLPALNVCDGFYANMCPRKCGLFGFPSPPRDGCPSGVVRWRETWSRKVRESADCFTKLREVSRSFTKVRTDQGCGYAMLRIVTGGDQFFDNEAKK